MKQIVQFSIAFGIFILTTIRVSAQSQEEIMPPVLPEFSAIIKTGKISLDWISGFRDIKEIGVQRSLDSVINFSTIGYANKDTRGTYQDNKPLPGTNYYRLLVVFNNGRFFYSKTILAQTDSSFRADMKLQYADIKDAARGLRSKEQENREPDRVVWHPSNYIYTTADGNVNIRLPEAPKKHYNIKFYETNGAFIFDIEKVKSSFLILEKAIFLHAGWFNFELFEDGKLKEKWNFFIPLNYKM
ncbi:hypothetical protein SAMN05444266_106462 [Chitinophaga jiangningensis]|uniref:Uncharacterized protein n=1 Tax=Chitinophaga jiangningensis TaxID=1419482 RepID=A0A1M7GA28_9BACT|nr:hypothetical protein SAMN05444266_106462 [Chitinophaga jiangningensis]